jgi:hypothetical protein
MDAGPELAHVLTPRRQEIWKLHPILLPPFLPQIRDQIHLSSFRTLLVGPRTNYDATGDDENARTTTLIPVCPLCRSLARSRMMRIWSSKKGQRNRRRGTSNGRLAPARKDGNGRVVLTAKGISRSRWPLGERLQVSVRHHLNRGAGQERRQKPWKQEA